MRVLRALRAIAGADDGPIDWAAVRDAAKASTDPGEVELDDGERAAYAAAVRRARARVEEATTLEGPRADELVLLDRHGWIDAAVADERTLWEAADAPDRGPLHGRFERLVALVTAGPESTVWSTLAGHAVGRYDPLNWVSVAAGTDGPLAVVPPNVERAAGRLDVEANRVRRWVVSYQVAVTATLDGAPWLAPSLRERLAAHLWGDVAETDSPELHAATLVTDAYASHLVARTLDDEPGDLRRALARDRWNRDAATRAFRRWSLLPEAAGAVEAAREFLEAVEDERGPDAVDALWRGPETVPTLRELGVFSTDEGASDVAAGGVRNWLDRVDP